MSRVQGGRSLQRLFSFSVASACSAPFPSPQECAIPPQCDTARFLKKVQIKSCQECQKFNKRLFANIAVFECTRSIAHKRNSVVNCFETCIIFC